MSELKYKRVLLKISGEAFGDAGGIDFQKVNEIAELIVEIRKEGAQIAIVNGAGNLFRGSNQGKSIDREQADYIGMVATIMNSLALKAILKEKNIPVSLYSAWEIKGFLPGFDSERAQKDFEDGQVVISTAGTGKPFFTTDTAGVQRAVDLGCDLMVKASTVDGVYSDDPKMDDDAQRFDQISYEEVLKNDLKILDRSAVEIAKEHRLKIIVSLFSKESILSALRGDEIGTLIS